MAPPLYFESTLAHMLGLIEAANREQGMSQSRVAVVTGATRGIGRAIALALAEEGYDLALIGRNSSALEEVADECRRADVEAEAIATDMTDMGGVRSIVEKTIQRFGRLDVLINNAGLLAAGDVGNADLEQWDQVLDVNVRAVIHLTRYALPEIRKQSEGAIINLCSVAGRRTFGGGGIYSSTKHAIHGFTGCLFEDAREDNIKVSAIYPGFVNTDMPDSSNLEKSRMIQPWDIAETVLFILRFPSTGCPTEIVVMPQRSPYRS